MSEITLPLDIESLEIRSQSIDNKGNIILDVVSKKTYSKCHKCGKNATKPNGKAPERLVRHLPILDKPVYLRITPVRYKCENCTDHPTTTEQYDWCSRNASTSYGLEEYLMRSLINSTVEDIARKERIGTKVVQSSLDRQVSKEFDWSLIDEINTIGIDEIAIKKGYQEYFTIISAKVNEDDLVVLGVLEGKEKETVKEFLDEKIPSHLKSKVKTVCTDLYDGFINSVIEVFGERVLVLDRFHIAKLYRKPLDRLRIDEMKRIKSILPKKEYDNLNGVMWSLRKDYECLDKEDKKKIKTLYKLSPKLKKAHKYAISLTQIFNTHTTRKSALAKLNRWIKKVEKSDLKCFNSFIITLKKYQPYIANYFKDRKSSGFVEGLNNKIKVIKRRCYGFIKAKSLFQRLFLDLQGFKTYT